MNSEQKKMAVRLGAGAALLAAGVFLKGTHPLDWLCFAAAYLSAGYDIPLRALRNLRGGEVFDENLLMTLATLGAIGVGAFEEAVAVMLFYQVGELFSDYAVDRSRKSISDLMDIHPEFAVVLRDGGEERVEPGAVAVGEVIVIRPGERVPLDGLVVKGASSLDTSALTGESVPADVREGDEVISGSINRGGLLEVRVTRQYEDSTVARILELVESAGSRKAKAEKFITRFARVYTPVVVLLAAVLALVPPLLAGRPWSVWLYRACSFLVVSCPCALVVSVPLSFFGGLGAASRQGILVKGGNYLEALGKLDTVVFDKTGTLTTGQFRVTGVYPERISRRQLLELAACAESRSTHPIAQSVLEAYRAEAGPERGAGAERILSAEETAGCGVCAVLGDGGGGSFRLYIGSEELMRRHGIGVRPVEDKAGTVLYVGREREDPGSGARPDGPSRDASCVAEREYLGAVVISDTVRGDVPEAIAGLRCEGVRRLVMLTGDREAVGRAVADRLGLDQVFAGLLPQEKVVRVEELLAETPRGRTLAFVGDGINDAPVLSRADVGIAMGGIGSDAAVEAADVVVMNDEPSRIVDGIRIAGRTMRIVRQNIVLAIGVKILVLVLAALGVASMWMAVFGDVGVLVIAVLNAMRALNYRGNG